MKGNLLIVDDEPMLSEGLKYMLRNKCENVFLAENGDEALKIILSHQIHCVLSDLYMPVMNGMELFKKVRETDEKLPFIFYTGQTVETIYNELGDYKNFNVVAKPLIEDVIKLVANFTSDI